MTKLLDLIRDGDRIVSAYMISKDALVIQVNYPPSAENVEARPPGQSRVPKCPIAVGSPGLDDARGCAVLKGQLEVLTAIATERQLAWSATVISVFSLIIGLASLAMGIAVYFEP